MCLSILCKDLVRPHLWHTHWFFHSATVMGCPHTHFFDSFIMLLYRYAFASTSFLCRFGSLQSFSAVFRWQNRERILPYIFRATGMTSVSHPWSENRISSKQIRLFNFLSHTSVHYLLQTGLNFLISIEHDAIRRFGGKVIGVL